jgi:FkbM family methyltransferase
MKNITLNFNNNEYTYHYVDGDDSGLGSIIEMIDNNEYDLKRFVGIKNKTIFDIGANHGLATIILAKQNPESTIYSFEPNPHIFNLLKTNVEANNLTNVILTNKAVHSDKNLKLIKHPLCSGASIMGVNKEKMDAYYNVQNPIYGKTTLEELSIDTISIDEILVEFKIKNIHLLKIDCEGSEYDIFTTSNLLFNKTKINNIIGEFHDLTYNEVKLTSHDLLDICKKNIDGIIDIKILKL